MCLSSLLQDLIDAVVAATEASTDDLIRREGRDIQLEESLDLHLPFLLPEGGYTCDNVRGIPWGFREFLEPICQKGTRLKKHYVTFAMRTNMTVMQLGYPRYTNLRCSFSSRSLLFNFSAKP